jgi:dihydrofolate reductase
MILIRPSRRRSRYEERGATLEAQRGTPAVEVMKAIAAMSLNRVIGADGKIPWRLPEDMKFFKQTTLGHVILMGRKTYESLGRPLPGREHWVVSRTADFAGVRMIRDLAEIAEPQDGRELFLIGGAELYAQLLPQCSELLLTHVKAEVAGDAFFPPFESEFEEAEILLETPEMIVRRYRRVGGSDGAAGSAMGT